MKNNKGSVLVWALVVIMIFSIFAVAALSITYTMVQRSFNNNSDRQLKLSAESAAFLIANEIVNANNTALTNQILNNRPNIQTTSQIFPEEKNMGNCIVKAKSNLEGNQIVITATASRNERQEIVSIVLSNNQSQNKWEIVLLDNFDIDVDR